MSAGAEREIGGIEFDTIYELDAHYQGAEADAALELVPEVSGSRQIGLAIIGVGRMGAIHLYNARRDPRAKLVYVMDSSQERLDYMRKKYFLDEAGVRSVGLHDWQTVLEDPQVEALVISTPTFTHEKYTRQGLEHGKHVLCEKPLAEKAQEVRSTVELAQSKKLKLIVAFNRRYDPSYRRIHEQVRRGDIGQVRLVKTCSRDSPLPPIEYIKISGGIFHDCFVHDLDLILWMARELPVEVYASGHAYDADYAKLGDFDTAVVSMKFRSGMMSLTDLSRHSAAGYDQRIEVFGPKGCLKLDEFPRAGWEKHTEFGVTRPVNCYSFASRYLEAYALELTNLFNLIEGHKTMEPMNLPYLNHICKITDACERSARTGKPEPLEWNDGDAVDTIM